MILVLLLFVASFAVVGYFLAGWAARRLPGSTPDLAAYAITFALLWVFFLFGDIGWPDRLGAAALIGLSLALGYAERRRRGLALRDVPPGERALSEH